MDKVFHMSEERKKICFTLIILDLGAPLAYHLILEAGIFTVVYIIFHAVGKIGGAAIGAWASHATPVVRKYLGMTLLPHSGVFSAYRNCSLRIDRRISTIWRYCARNDCSSSYQRDHRSVYGQARIQNRRRSRKSPGSGIVLVESFIKSGICG